MYLKYSIILLLIACSFLSAVEFAKEKKELFWKVSFYFSAYLFIMSFMKFYLGYHKETLLESFWDIRMATFVHYGVPLVIIATVAPIILKLLFKEKRNQIIRYFDSTLFFTLSFTFYFVRKINNKTYCIAFFIALIITIVAILLRKTESVYIERHEIKKKAMEAVPILLCYLITIVIYTPNELYLNNATDFPMSYWYFFGKLLLAGVIVTVILMAGMLLYLTQSHMKLYLAMLFSFLTIGYIQGLFLNGSMGVLDGTGNNLYSKLEIYINLGIWVLFIGVVLIFCWKKNDVTQKFMKVISIWIVLIQIISLGTMIITSNDTSPKSELTLTTEGMTEVGERNNIIVFILDKFDGSYIDEITDGSPDFFQPLNDFVNYKNVTSAFSPTYDSIPFLLSGTDFVEESTVDYVQYAYGDDNLLQEISDSGYDIGVYTHKRYVTENMKNVVSNYEEGVKRTCSMSDLFSMMTQCSRYKMAPFAVKWYYIYDTSDIALLVVNDKIVNIENDLPFYHELVEKGLHVSPDDVDGTFRFIHMHGAHPPYTMTEDFQYLEYDYRRDDGWGSGVSQWKGAMKIVYEYIRQLKELGKYDDSLIIITADHGLTHSLSDEEGNMIEITYPILFVKEPYETHEYMVTNNAPVCHADIIATIRKKVGMNVLDKALSEIDRDDSRIRYMNISTPDLFEKYEIDGEVSQISSWHLLYRAQKNLESTH